MHISDWSSDVSSSDLIALNEVEGDAVLLLGFVLRQLDAALQLGPVLRGWARLRADDSGLHTQAALAALAGTTARGQPTSKQHSTGEGREHPFGCHDVFSRSVG